MAQETTMTGSGIGAAREQLVEDFQKIVSDSEALLRALASVPGEKTAALRAGLEDRLASTKERLREIQGAAYEKGAAAIRATDDYAHENPWQLIGIAAGVGLLIGLLIAHRE
jgi:ElaB/YqjD/DUF883 family membrane-anchored ribosome-binding protein